ncbi:MAG TPA: HAMP domain-containing protein, partial [Thermodesulfobacteriota bacterium]|nr:HAMP domain-containing protein [Thermodesulfobacteriota bacterium]
MRLRLRWKWTVFFICLLLIFILIQVCLFYAIRKSFFFSSLLSFILLIPLAYLLGRSLTDPILEVTRKAVQLLSSTLEKEVRVSSSDELGSLSKTIGEMGTQLKTKIEEISKEKDYLQT